MGGGPLGWEAGRGMCVRDRQQPPERAEAPCAAVSRCHAPSLCALLPRGFRWGSLQMYPCVNTRVQACFRECFYSQSPSKRPRGGHPRVEVPQVCAGFCLLRPWKGFSAQAWHTRVQSPPPREYLRTCAPSREQGCRSRSGPQGRRKYRSLTQPRAPPGSPSSAPPSPPHAVNSKTQRRSAVTDGLLDQSSCSYRQTLDQWLQRLSNNTSHKCHWVT